jgi:hypothetical protein
MFECFWVMITILGNSSRGKRAAPATDYRFLNVVSEHLWQVVSNKGKSQSRSSGESPKSNRMQKKGVIFQLPKEINFRKILTIAPVSATLDLTWIGSRSSLLRQMVKTFFSRSSGKWFLDMEKVKMATNGRLQIYLQKASKLSKD